MNSGSGGNQADVSRKPRYRLLRKLEGDDSCLTYLAEDGHHDNGLCLFRELTPRIRGELALQEARRLVEQRINHLLQLKHPQIQGIRGLAAGKGQDRVGLFLVQAYVEGPTYYQLLETRRGFGGSFSETEVTQLLYQILPALDYLHSQGIVHGNLSPHTIVLRNVDGLPVLTDVGHVDAIAAEVENQLGFTTDASWISPAHTMGYAPPDQSQPGTFTQAGDLYSLAATALVLLTARSPQELYDPQTATWNWQQFIVLNHRLGNTLDRMLAYYSAEDRFLSAQEVLQALHSDPPMADGVGETPAWDGTISLDREALDDLPAYPVTNDGDPLILDDGMGDMDSPEDDLSPGVVARGLSEEQSSSGFGQAVLGLAVLLGIAGGLLWLIFSLRDLRNPLSPPPSTVAPPTSTSQPTSAPQYDPAEQARRANLARRQEELGVNSAVLTRMTDQLFYQAYPNLRNRPLTDRPEDAPLRLRWDSIANSLLDTIELNLSPQARRTLGQYGPANRERWQARVNARFVSSQALYDLTDAKFNSLFPDLAGQAVQEQPVGQIWYGLADDRVVAIESGQQLTEIAFQPGAFSEQVEGTLEPGEGQIYLLNLLESQPFRFNLQAPANSTQLSFYVPRPTEQLPHLLADSTVTSWSGDLPQSGYYEIVVVSTANQPISYSLNMTASNVTSTPSEPPAEAEDKN